MRNNLLKPEYENRSDIDVNFVSTLEDKLKNRHIRYTLVPFAWNQEKQNEAASVYKDIQKSSQLSRPANIESRDSKKTYSTMYKNVS